ncbi:MAG: SSU ribosomal protein S2e (S5p) [Candidatus Methanosuratincola subterraneus]|uniref:Small ribosomal subunit protein uS5 n=1 Tax=Methanosuratincola subterraneus TaxID=2593994 RepID=A0A3S3SS23_METS7|nr:MAG: SSU ribosomal protein S2e (S5p) [Candidatus Methanosuratincola subterraneus]
MSYQTTQWIPRTSLGKAVLEGKITSIKEVFEQNQPIKEPEIVDALLPDIKHEVLDVSVVQKQTDAGEITKFKIGVVVGNGDGYIGVGIGKSKQMRFAIDKAVADAKLNLTPVRRGCGNWECPCGKPHSLPFKVTGKNGSVSVMLLPAPKGIGLVGGEVAKTILRYAGIKDAWVVSFGETRTTINFAGAVYDALKNTYRFKR